MKTIEGVNGTSILFPEIINVKSDGRGKYISKYNTNL